MTKSSRAGFSIGELVHHKLFDYRGVVIDVDPVFSGTEEWYEHVARSRPPKDKPWYHVLVDGAKHQTYVAERNLERDNSAQPINHPMLSQYFTGFNDGSYVLKSSVN